MPNNGIEHQLYAFIISNTNVERTHAMLIAIQSARMIKSALNTNHIKDEDCFVNHGTGLCLFCGVDHGSVECPECRNTAFHHPECSRSHGGELIGKTLGCYDCDGEFGSAASLEIHGRATGHKIDANEPVAEHGKAEVNVTFLERVVDRLTELGVMLAKVEYPGCISLPCGDFSLLFGVSNETWGADVNKDVDGTDTPTGDCLVTDCPTNCKDAGTVALAIKIAVIQYVAKLRAEEEKKVITKALEHVKAIEQAMSALNHLWQTKDNDLLEKYLGGKAYPFNQSFDEQLFDVISWRREVEGKVARA